MPPGSGKQVCVCVVFCFTIPLAVHIPRGLVWRPAAATPHMQTLVLCPLYSDPLNLLNSAAARVILMYVKYACNMQTPIPGPVHPPTAAARCL
eukprot:scaffold111689_cov27-Tisochrysis_lutea.AAC.4